MNYNTNQKEEIINQQVKTKNMFDLNDQFKLLSENISDEYFKSYSDVNDDTFYNQFELDEGEKFIGGRRDNSIRIEPFFVDKTTKKEINLKENVPKNKRKGIPIYDRNKIMDSLKNNKINKNNDYTDDMYLREDMTPIRYYRPEGKTLEEYRGNSVNSQPSRQDKVENLNTSGIYKTLDPQNVNLCVNKSDQLRRTNEDFIKTTGQLQKSVDRKTEHFISTHRDSKNEYVAPSYSNINKQSLKNLQKARPTIKENTVNNKYISNFVKIKDGPRELDDEARQTLRSNETNYVSIPKGHIDKQSFQNNQEAKQTIRQQTENKKYISNFVNLKENYRQFDDEAKKTTREEKTKYTPYPRNDISKQSYQNNQKANKTIREDVKNTKYVSNFVNLKEGYRDFDDVAKKTTREEKTKYTPFPRREISREGFKNNQKARPTIKEQTESKKYLSNLVNITENYKEFDDKAKNTLRGDKFKTLLPAKYNINESAYHNNQKMNKTIREQTENKSYISNFTNLKGNYKETDDQAKNTLRGDEQKFVSHGKNDISREVLKNNQPANNTGRETIGETNYVSNSFTRGTQKYYKNNDNIRPKNIVFLKDHKGVSKPNVQKEYSRNVIDNFEQYTMLEESLDLTNREHTGGAGQISLGKDKYGKMERRHAHNSFDYTKRKNINFVTNNIIKENFSTRGKETLQSRSQINPHLNATLDGNPYVNNMVHKSISDVDKISNHTFKSDRVISDC